MNETHRFRLIVERQAGALERVLGVARRRRFGLESLFVVSDDTETWNVSITATGVPESEASLALRQFASLTNVRNARFEEA